MFDFGFCQDQRPAELNGEAEVRSSSTAFDANTGSMGRTELLANSCLPRTSISGHLNWEFQDNPPKWAASLHGISAVRLFAGRQQNCAMCSPL